MRIHVLQHAPSEDPGYVATWAQFAGHDLAIVQVYAGEALPAASEVLGLIVLGGPVSVHDTATCPWLVAEKRLIASTLQRPVPILGICLGSQLVAEALGADVKASPAREVGWLPVRLDLPGSPTELMVMHWHGDMFDVPEGARRIAASDGCPNQGFAWGDRVLALQFHPEVTPEQLLRFAPLLAEEDTSLPLVQAAPAIVAAAALYCDAANSMLNTILTSLFGSASEAHNTL